MQIWGLFLKEYKEPSSNIGKEQAASQRAVKARLLLFPPPAVVCVAGSGRPRACGTTGL